MGRKWYLFSNWLVALIAVFYCHYFVVMVCSGLGRWPWDTARFQVFCQRRRKGQDILLFSFCSYNVFEIPSSGRRLKEQLWCGLKHWCNIQGWLVQV